MESLIELKEVEVFIQNNRVLYDINLELKEKEVLTVVGPNGAGKTTLIKTILGLTKPTAGTIQKNPKLRLGYMPQRFHITPQLPINVLGFLMTLDNVTHQDCCTIFSELDISIPLTKPLQGLSTGEFQRVLFARTLLRKPNLLILDEPAQGLDVKGQGEFYAQINHIREKLKAAVLLVSHDLHFVMGGTNKVICLNQHICCHGPAEQIKSHPEFLNLLGKHVDSSLAFYAHHHNHEHPLDTKNDH